MIKKLIGWLMLIAISGAVSTAFTYLIIIDEGVRIMALIPGGIVAFVLYLTIMISLLTSPKRRKK